MFQSLGTMIVIFPTILIIVFQNGLLTPRSLALLLKKYDEFKCALILVVNISAPEERGRKF